MTEWTSQQETAINARDSSFIVAAAAGSGKTAVLTERLARLISDESAHVRADRIIAVTFTNDAAAELRKRLDSNLSRLISADPGNTYLLKQQTLLRNAKISTINSFCFDLLRDNIDGQEITSGFGILDESDDKLIKSRSMDELINLWSKDRYDDISFLYDKFCLKSDSSLADVLASVDNYLGSEAFRELWLKKAAAEFDKKAEDSVLFKAVCAEAVKELEKAAQLGKECSELIGEIFFDPDCSSAAKLYAQSEDDRKRVETALEIIRSGKEPTVEQKEYCCGFERRYYSRNKSEFDAELNRIYAAKRTCIVGIVRDNIRVLSGFADDFAESGRVTRIICEMLGDYHHLIWEKKCKKNAISFDDGERLALELLSETDADGNVVQSETARRIADYYDIIMVDEYQDSNNKEDLIFKLISKDFKSGEEQPRYGTNAFVVGDVKQSIYRFRLANPRNFINTLAGAEPYENETDSPNRSIFLNRNFRSSEGVINYVNYIFTQIMSSQCGDVNYNKDEMLYFGASRYNQAEPKPETKTCIMLINTDSSDDGADTDDGEESEASVDSEASCTAEKISRMLRSKTPVVETDGKLRPCRMSDFCILIRAKKYTKSFVSELKKRGIDARGEEEKGYLSSREIAVLLDLLRVIDNPLLDVPLAAVLLSPMYMFDLEELAFLRTLRQNGSIYSVMNEYSEQCAENGCETPLSLKCAAFLKTLGDFRLEAVTKNVSELIAEIYDTTDFVFVMQMLDDGEKKRANLRALIQYAKSYEETSSADGTGGLTGFIRYIDRVIENGGDFTQGKVSASAGDYVSIKTIHKSKGLEYPFVFLAETSGRFQFDNGSAVCAENGKIGYVLYCPENVRRHKTAQYKHIYSRNVCDTVSEEMRLLYVALTRAKQQLFINLKFGVSAISRVEYLMEQYAVYSGNMNELAGQARLLSDWLWMSLMEHERFADIIELFRREIASIRENSDKQRKIKISEKKLGSLESGLDAYELPKVKYTDDVFMLETVSPSELDFTDESADVEIAVPDEKICARIRDIIGFKYDITLSETPSKLSVTQITKKFGNNDEFFDFKLSRPRFLSEETEFTGAERGTAIHTFFQYCDFSAAESDLESEIRRVAERGFITRAQADSIDRENAAAFFESELYSRIKGADRVWRERKFMTAVADLDIELPLSEAFKNSDGMIKGIIDLVFEENCSLVIVDYKSDRRASEKQLAERYTNQLRLYKSALELISGQSVSEICLYSFELKRKIEINF